jgi:Tfp pilus assembly protein FimT
MSKDGSYFETRSQDLRHGQRGSTLVQLIIVVAIIATVTTMALLNLRNSRATIKLQNSVRQLSSYMEKARVDAVRRHSTTTLQFTDPSTYTVTMDFNNNNSPITRTFSLDQGVQVPNSVLPNVVFNWRGRTITAGVSCVTTFAVVNNLGNAMNVDVSGSGDVTIENQSPTLPNITYTVVNSNTSIKSQTTVSGSTVVDNTPCLDVSGQGVPGSSGPPSCQISTNTSSISIRKNGGATGSVVISMNPSSLVAASFPSNLTVSPTTANVSTGTTFSIVSKNNLRGPFDVTFSAQCGYSVTVRVNVTN